MCGCTEKFFGEDVKNFFHHHCSVVENHRDRSKPKKKSRRRGLSNVLNKTLITEIKIIKENERK